jgi:hypothetical protein
MGIRPLLLPTLLLAVLASAAPARAASFGVNTSRDGLDEDGALPCDIGGKWVDVTPNTPFDSQRPCSLRAAIQLAHVTPEPDNIGIDLNTQESDNVSTIRLSIGGAGEDDGLTGDLDISTQINIAGEGNSGSDQAFIHGKGDRIFDIHPGGIVDLRRVTLVRGKTSKRDADPSGGCLRSAGTFTSGSLFLFSCASAGDGGGMSVTGGSADIVNVIFSTNKATGEGGGLFVGPGGVATLDKVAFGRNGAADGGALATRGDLSMRNTTIDDNASKLGAGGIAVLGAGPTTIRTATITENGAVNLDASQNTGTLSIASSIVWGAETSDCTGTVPSAGGNLESGTSCGFTGTNDQQGITAAALALAPLNNYDGLVPTRPPGAGSAAIDHGIDDYDSQCFTDARNRLRWRFDGSGLAHTDSGATDFPATGPALVPVVITSPDPPDTATQGVELVHDVDATNSHPDRPQCVGFSVGGTGFIVPDGLEIDARTGVITWTPLLPGDPGGDPDVLFPINAFDPGSPATTRDTQSFELDVFPAP